MRLGVVFPQTEIGNDPAAIKDYAQAVEGLVYDHVIVYDHVLGAHPDRFEGRFRPPYTHETPFHEPLVLFGFFAAVTQRLELTSSIIILPQRQTALVAKQAAAVDVLSGGRLRLGVGIGWNFVEYEALGENFRNRGRRVEEQVAVIRKLWTEDLVDFEGRWHTLRQVGIKPRPVQQPIPIWFGGGSDVVLRRIARIGDGWFPQFRPGPESQATLERLRSYVGEARRQESDVGIEGRVSMFNTPESEWEQAVRWWRDMRATHLSVNTMNAGFHSPADHLEALKRFRAVAAA